MALGHIEAALHTTRGDGINETGIRASIYREMGRLDAALKDYGKVAEARRERGGGVYGEALSELGYAMVLSGKSQRGIPLLEQGLDLLRAEPPSGFQIRAMRKLAVGYARRGKFLAALDLAVEAHDLATARSARTIRSGDWNVLPSASIVPGSGGSRPRRRLSALEEAHSNTKPAKFPFADQSR